MAMKMVTMMMMMIMQKQGETSPSEEINLNWLEEVKNQSRGGSQGIWDDDDANDNEVDQIDDEDDEDEDEEDVNVIFEIWLCWRKTLKKSSCRWDNQGMRW